MGRHDKNHEHMLGGNWTEEKLKCLREYLVAYLQVMKNQPDFHVCYIDAFAGTGYRNLTPKPRPTNESIFEDQEELDVTLAFNDGSARIALKLDVPFDEYIFIERDKKHFQELIKLPQEFPRLANRMRFEMEDANEFLIRFCKDKKAWIKRRAVLFLDPYGMQVRWETLQAIAETCSIDLWLLFPLGQGVNRMLVRDGRLSKDWVKKLDTFFGDRSWEAAFYEPSRQIDLFEASEEKVKIANYDTIESYFVKKLKEIFPAVAPHPLRLVNQTGCPIFLFFFACANKSPSAFKIAIDIAGHILKSRG